jgi:PAS domain S-box-containing protein
VLASIVAFLCAAPFAKVKLVEVWPFIPGYQSALLVTDLVTAVLLLAQFEILGDRGLAALASGYLFTAMMAVVHALTFPRLFTPHGLLGAGPQTTAWLYMVWHAGFPLSVIAYALQHATVPAERRIYYTAGACTVAVVASVGATLVTTVGHALLPPIMSGDSQTPSLKPVVSVILLLNAAAGLVLWRRKPRSLLDIWLIVVTWAWLLDVALATALGAGRFDFGFYAGRAYGLMAASLVLTVLLVATGNLYARTARSLETAHRRRLADAISRNEQRLHLIVESVPNALVMINRSGLIEMLNAETERLFGYSRDELLGQPVEKLVPERHSSHHPELRRAFSDDPRARPMGVGRDLFALRKDGTEFPVEIGLNPIETDDGTMVLSAVVDITDRKQREERLQVALREKEVLLAEIHHRVKNNLQVVSSLLSLQSAEIGDDRVLDAMRECQNRITSMSLIHQTLYESQDFAEVDFGQFLNALVPVLVSTYALDPSRISIDIELPSMKLPINAAIPCGLIVNELISNALKHAFPGDRRGRVGVAMKHEEENHVSLTVSDDGVGLPDEAYASSAKTLGLQIVNVLTSQLEGVLYINPRAPTQFTVRFSLSEPRN